MTCDVDILNSDCLIVNANKILSNKKLRWVIYNNISLDFETFLISPIQNNTNPPFMQIMGFSEFNNKNKNGEININVIPGMLVIIDGFLISKKDISFSFNIEYSGFLSVLFDDVNVPLNYSKITQSIYSGQSEAINKIDTNIITLKANKIYRISFLHYQRDQKYKGPTILMKDVFNNISDLDEALLFATADNTSLNNTVVQSNNNLIFEEFLRFDYYSTPDIERTNEQMNNNIEPKTLKIFENDPLDLSGLVFLNRRYLRTLNVKKSKLIDASAGYFKYIIDGYINFKTPASLALNVFGGYIMVLMLKVEDNLISNILNVSDAKNIVITSGNTEGTYAFTNQYYGKYRIQIIYTSAGLNDEDNIGYDIKLKTGKDKNNINDIPLSWISTDYIIDFQNEYNNALLSNCGIGENDWINCADEINNSFISEMSTRSSKIYNFIDKINETCANISIKDDPKIYDGCIKYNNSKNILKCNALEGIDLINNKECINATKTNKNLYQKYMDACTASEDSILKCGSFSKLHEINLYDSYCTNISDKKKFLESNYDFNFCKKNMSSNLSKDMDLELENYCINSSGKNEIDIMFSDICAPISDNLKASKCLNNLENSKCYDFLTNHKNIGTISTEIVNYCNNSDNPVCDVFYSSDQTDKNIKDAYYKKIVKNCSDLGKDNNFTAPNTKCYKFANNTSIDYIVNKSPASYFLKPIMDYCTSGSNILTSFCQNSYINIKKILKPKESFNNYYRGCDDNEDEDLSNLVFIIIFITLFVILIFTICKRKKNNTNKLIYSYYSYNY